MSSKSFSPSSVSFDEELTHEMANVIKNFNTKELIEYLRSKDLKLTESHFEILHKEEVTGLAFFEEKFRSIDFTLGPATVLAKVIADLKKSRSLDFITNVFYQNCKNKEKRVDIFLVSKGMDVVKTDTPSILILVASNGLSGFLRSYRTFYCLDNYYKCFTYALGSSSEKFFLEITDSKIIKRWKDGNILDCYVSLKLFRW
ncbi:hypothetical protein Glove_99g345 [Diversispora epigaea]|uniref:SAM domain-containing protein n=1 Tax=Diversispora epigaea TaxID=1348612 RepID=A0A397J8V5_9GLOM|nr:hypothetical protein Glove_99g345 [Diversispora epigaea]